MRTDRYRDAALTIIAIALCVIAVPRLETHEAMAAPVPPAEAATDMRGEGLQLEPGRSSTRALAGPLRWLIGYAGAVDSNIRGSNECFTSISMLNTSASSISTDVIFYGANDSTVGSTTRSIPSQGSTTIIAHDSSGTIPPFSADTFVSTGPFNMGFARVYADDPRLLVTAFLVCTSDQSNDWSSTQAIRSMANIPAYPVGATREFFQAEMPGTRMQSRALPEIPE